MENPIILIVEDHLPARILLSQWLSAIFPYCTFLEARSGEEAIASSIERNPDIIVMDIGLPQMDGIETTRRIKEIQPDSKIVILTIHDDNSYRKSAREAGASSYINKQQLRDELAPTLAQLISEERKI